MRPPLDIEFALKAVVGTASPVLDVVTSFQEQIAPFDADAPPGHRAARSRTVAR